MGAPTSEIDSFITYKQTNFVNERIYT